MSIYTELLAAGIPLDHHESDLYALVDHESRRIVEAFPFKGKTRKNITTFISQIDGKTWYEIPFSYDPFWGKVNTRDARK